MAPPKTALATAQQLVLIYSHPLRHRIVEHLRTTDSKESSPSKMAKELGETAEHVSYHAKRLARAGVLEGPREEKGRLGSIEHWYRLAPPFQVDETQELTLTGCCTNASTVDAIASQLRQAEGSPYATLLEIASIVRSSGRLVCLPGEEVTA